MNNAYYNLSCNPFDKQELKEADCFASKDHKAMTDRLNFLKEVRGIGVFTAAPGMGKTFTLRCFEKSLNQSLYQMHYICLSTVAISEFYKAFCDCLNLEKAAGKSGMFKAIQERIYHMYKEKRRPIIVAVDEAQYLNPDILKDLKMLMNFQYDSLNCFTLILCGEQHFNRTLEKPVHEALRQRICVHYTFNGLDPDEIAEYIYHKLSLAGGSSSIMDESAVSAINGLSQGNPRMIDNLMTDALMLGMQMKKQVIDADVIMAAANAAALG